ncbi:hypothetical protein ACOZ35_08920 [Halorubrum xinjiangense]|uniref:hypothetical protein n=1 Tax=Halorubrum xinjiangense TaxID=261291 RepID=UPI003C6EEF12
MADEDHDADRGSLAESLSLITDIADHGADGRPQLPAQMERQPDRADDWRNRISD